MFGEVGLKGARFILLSLLPCGGRINNPLQVRAAGKPHAPPGALRFHGTRARIKAFMSLHIRILGFNVLYMDCRGQGGRSEDLGEVKGTTYKGLIIRGLEEGPDKLYYKRVYLDTVRCARIMMSMDGVDKNRVGVMGGSQGGALTLACAALEPRIRLRMLRRRFYAISSVLSNWDLCRTLMRSWAGISGCATCAMKTRKASSIR